MNEIVDVLVGIAVVAGILVLTRPGSQGPKLVQDATAGYANILGTATGGISGPVSYK
jgi:hypothetical protein